MSTYTKGPWALVDTPAIRSIFNGCPVITADGIDDAIIAAIGEDVPESDGNGLLMAAAPELLEASKIALKVLEAMGHKDFVCAIDLRAAIAKAEPTHE